MHFYGNAWFSLGFLHISMEMIAFPQLFPRLTSCRRPYMGLDLFVGSQVGKKGCSFLGHI